MDKDCIYNINGMCHFCGSVLSQCDGCKNIQEFILSGGKDNEQERIQQDN